MTSHLNPLYIFVDESGNFDYSPKGTKYYVITALATFYPSEKETELIQLRQDILAGKVCPGLDPKYLQNRLSRMFHATNDKQAVRNEVFQVIQTMQFFRAYSIVIQKSHLFPVLRDPARFYPQFMCYILDYIFKAYVYSELRIFVSGEPVLRHKNIFKKAVHDEILKKHVTKPYSISYPKAETLSMFQVVDYISWAIYRKWERNDERSYSLIRDRMGAPELDIFRDG